MNKLVWKLKGQPDVIVEIVSGGDDLCAVCPNRTGGRCLSDEKVRGMDSKVLSLCGIAPGYKAPWKELSELAAEKVFAAGCFEDVCGDCQWADLCRKTKRGMINEE